MTVGKLADEITTLAAHMHAAMCRWLVLVAEFDRREGWANTAAGRALTGSRGVARSRPAPPASTYA